MTISLPYAFLLAARPKTLPASLAPVLLGGKLAAQEGPFAPVTFLLTLLFALLIQIGTNYANDYFDFLKGADTAQRIGPKRAVQQGWVSPNAMWRAAILTFSAAFLIAIPLMIQVGLWSLPVALLCILLGILYTGGPIPLGYLGLGEPLVFLFFGPIALTGTYFLQTGHISFTAIYVSISIGLLSSAILTANNLRDFATDLSAGKKTLVVRFGIFYGKWLYALSLLTAALLATISFPYSSSSFLFAIIPMTHLLRHKFQPLLPQTAFLLMLYTTLFLFFQ